MDDTRFSPITGQDIDPEAFRRVWDRVMSDRDPGPLAVHPAQPSISPEEAAAQQRSPVPVCPEEPTLPPVPRCPAGPGSCEGCPPPLCLGEAAQADTGLLRELMDMARAGAAASQWLALRLRGSAARSLSAIAAQHRRAGRQLSAAYFLITGKRHQPPQTPVHLPLPLPMALRTRFRWEQNWERVNQNAADGAADPCLKALYQKLAREGADHAAAIRELLEEMG